MDKRLKFNEPWILQRADPYVYDKDGGLLQHQFATMGETLSEKGY